MVLSFTPLECLQTEVLRFNYVFHLQTSLQVLDEYTTMNRSITIVSVLSVTIAMWTLVQSLPSDELTPPDGVTSNQNTRRTSGLGSNRSLIDSVPTGRSDAAVTNHARGSDDISLMKRLVLGLAELRSDSDSEASVAPHPGGLLELQAHWRNDAELHAFALREQLTADQLTKVVETLAFVDHQRASFERTQDEPEFFIGRLHRHASAIIVSSLSPSQADAFRAESFLQ